MNPGFKTTEFAVVIFIVVLNVLGALTGLIKDPALAAIASSAVAGAYAIGRSMVKMYNVQLPPEIDKKG